MADYGITSTGFSKKTLDILKSEFEENLKSEDAFGESIDFSEQDPLFQFSMPILYLVSELWEVAENVFYSASPKFAEGNLLSNTGKYIGIARKQATQAIGTIRVTGASGTSIESGFRISTENGVVFQTTEKKTIGSSGYVDIPIICENTGVIGNLPANTVNVIVNPIIGVTSATNLSETIKGQDVESDTQFKTRYEETTQGGDGSTAIAIRNNLLKVTGVTSATVKENDTNDTVDDVPPHNIYALVKGGNNADIANAIFAKKPGGIGTHGTTSITIIDSQGIGKVINFSRPTSKTVYANITITKTSDYPANGDELIKESIVKYINNLSIDEDVIIYKIINTIAQLGISGIDDIHIELSDDGSTYSIHNIIIGTEENAFTDSDKVVII